MQDICRTRGDTYFCLSVCFDYPSEKVVEPASARAIAETIESLEHVGGLESLADEVNNFEAELARNAHSPDAVLSNLQIEYSRLFLGPTKPQVYPYEAAFLSQSGWPTTTSSELASAYRQEGLKLAPGFKESPDHISIEFEFMSHLCCQEMKARERNDAESLCCYRRQQRAFLGNHIVHWVPVCLAAVERAAVVGFYRSLARIARGFVVWDYERIEASGGKQ
ncbi:MAG TPA: molecular chaperone TorD family protein [Blastocatellia bacterium]|nr:molecular chaperone TorD family protein [Blastocatellia bacterium]